MGDFKQSEVWKNIDTNIVDNKVTKAPFELTFTDGKIFIKNKKNYSELTLELSSVKNNDNVESIKNNVVPSIKNNKIFYKDLYLDTDFEIEILNSQVKFKRILKSNKAPTKAEFNIITKGNPIIKYNASNKKDVIDVDVKIEGGKIVENIDASNKQFPIIVDPSWQVGANDDDYKAITDIDWGSSVELSYTENTYTFYVWNRWQNVTIPNGATIN